MASSRLPALALTVLVLAGCADGDEPAASTAPTGSPAVTASPEPDRGEPAGPDDDVPAESAVPPGLDFVLEDLNGGQVVGAELTGRDLVLWFWAPW